MAYIKKIFTKFLQPKLFRGKEELEGPGKIRKNIFFLYRNTVYARAGKQSPQALFSALID